MFTRVSMTPFAGTSKLGWFGADILGFFYTTVAAFAVLLVVTIVSLGLLDVRIWPGNIFLPLLMLAAALAFVVVFPLRRNFIVVGGRREIRYLCRWL